MKNIYLSFLLIILGSFFNIGKSGKVEVKPKIKNYKIIKLPQVSFKSEVSVEEALRRRRSVREYAPIPLTLEEVSQLCWAAQGITLPSQGFRTAPSAGATYPLKIYLVVKSVKNLGCGVYLYLPESHALMLIKSGKFWNELKAAALGQEWVGAAPLNLVVAADYKRTTLYYGIRGERYVHMEAGHVGQNIHLQCETLGMGCVMVGAFKDEVVKKLLEIKEEPLYIIPVGKKVKAKVLE